MNIIDIICCALILLIAFFGVVKGFFSVLLRFAAYAVSIVCAKLASVPVAGIIYNSYLKGGVISRLEQLLPAGSVSGGIDQLKETLLETLPESIVHIVQFFHLDSLFSSGSAAQKTLTVAQIEQDYAMPLITKVLTIVSFLAVFFILSLILRIIAGILDKVLFKKKDSLLSTTNKILGGVLGLIQGIVPAAAVCLILNLLAPVFNNPSFTAVVENSLLCGLVAKIIS